MSISYNQNATSMQQYAAAVLPTSIAMGATHASHMLKFLITDLLCSCRNKRFDNIQVTFE